MKLVVLSSRFPFPLEKGDKLRLYHQLKSLSKHFEVHLISLSSYTISEEDKSALLQFCKEVKIYKTNKVRQLGLTAISFLNGRPFQVSYYYNPSIHKKILKDIAAIKPDRIYCQLARMAEYIKDVSVEKTIDFMDVFSVGMAKRAEVVSPLVSWVYKLEARRMANYEKKIARHFDHQCIISEQDKSLIDIQSIKVIPNGVDLEFFAATEEKKEYDIAFVGNMGYLPNIAAAEYLVKETLERLASSHYKVLIAGARPDQRVKQLASETVTVSGWIDDIRSAYASSRIFVAPLFKGTGQQNKILEAMAMGIPIITTSEVNRAIGAKPDKEVILAENQQEFANAIDALLNDPEKIDKLSKNALKFVQAKYGWKGQNKKLITLLS